MLVIVTGGITNNIEWIVMKMIDLTRLNGSVITINAELIEVVEETPDTVVTLTTGRKFIVKESRQELKNLVLSYKRKIFAEFRDLE